MVVTIVSTIGLLFHLQYLAAYAVFLTFFFFTRAQRALTAFRALSLRSSAVMLAARAGPPFKPPLRPKDTAAWILLRAFLACPKYT